MNRFLCWLTNYLRAREIRGEHGEPYLERYSLCGLFGWRAYIHRFIASDPDRGLHDHPWGWSVSLILSGGYREIRHRPRTCKPVERRLRRLGVGRLNIIRGGDFHRVLLDPGQEAWTLFIHGPRVKGWGFLRNGVYTVIAKDTNDYPQQAWWKAAPRGRELRAQQSKKQTAIFTGSMPAAMEIVRLLGLPDETVWLTFHLRANKPATVEAEILVKADKAKDLVTVLKRYGLKVSETTTEAGG